MLVDVNYPQKATYWTPNVDDGRGAWSYGAPVVLDCRWEERMEEIVTSTAERVVSHTAVFTENVLEEGGYLYLGETSEPNPTVVQTGSKDRAFKIRRISSIPSIDATFHENKAFL